MAAGLFAGVSNKLYRNTATWASPTWDEITNVKDLKLAMTMSLAEVRSRGSGFVQNLTGLKTVQTTFNMINDSSVADHNILRDAFIGGTLLGYAVADQAIATSGADHFRFEGYVSKFDTNQNLEEGNMVDVTLDLAYSSNVPLWTDVA